MRTVRELAEAGDLNREWPMFEADALESFLKIARNAIAEEVSKAKYETLAVRRSNTTCWIEYKGVDSSDNPLDWMCSMTPTKGNEVLLFARSKAESPRSKEHGGDERRLPLYQASPGQIVSMFMTAYGK